MKTTQTRDGSMFTGLRQTLLAAAMLPLMLAGCDRAAAADQAALPKPTVDMPAAKAGETQSVVFAGGCFWGVQAVFQHTKGVRSAVSGYAGGASNTAQYEIVSSGATGHAESVQVTYDPSQVSYGQLMQIFFSVAHDPTELNRQGPDSGTQYRSEIFTSNADQARVTQAYIAQLNAAKVFRSPIVTKVEPLPAFYPAESYHQDYATLHPESPYIFINDAPKVRQLKASYAGMYLDKPVLTKLTQR